MKKKSFLEFGAVIILALSFSNAGCTQKADSAFVKVYDIQGTYIGSYLNVHNSACSLQTDVYGTSSACALYTLAVKKGLFSDK